MPCVFFVVSLFIVSLVGDILAKKGSMPKGTTLHRVLMKEVELVIPWWSEKGENPGISLPTCS